MVITYFQLVPGETALAFYTAMNPTNKPVTGISTYNVIPFEAGQYFNKIQCFCFEEQLLNPHEQVTHLTHIYSLHICSFSCINSPSFSLVDRQSVVGHFSQSFRVMLILISSLVNYFY